MKTGYANNSALTQQWLNQCPAVIEWKETSAEQITFRYDESVEVWQVPNGIDFAGDPA